MNPPMRCAKVPNHPSHGICATTFREYTRAGGEGDRNANFRFKAKVGFERVPYARAIIEIAKPFKV